MNFPTKEFFDIFKKTPGALSVCESISIYWLGTQVKSGACIDIGSNAAKAAMSAAHGIQNGSLIMVDPIYDLTNLEAWKHSIQGHPDNLACGYASEPDFKDKVKDRIINVSDMTPALQGDYSLSALNKFSDYGYVFLDSDDHQEELVMSEVKLIEDKMIQGGIIAFHDFQNQYHAPKMGYDYLLATGKYEPIEIPWEEIVEYVKENDLEKGNDSWHMKDVEFPCFVGAVKRK